jgi:polar amino acid transport system permease protein
MEPKPPALLSRLFLAPPGHGQTPLVAGWLNATLAIGVVLAIGAAILGRSTLRWDWEAVAGYWQLFVQGWGTTLAVSIEALVLSTLIAVGTSLARRSRLLPLRYMAAGYVELIRGTPLLVQIYVLFYIVADAVRLENRLIAGVLILSLFSGAYLAEVFRAGIESVGRSQWESAAAIGLTRAQTYRHVILPQALRSVLPSVAGQFVSLIKDSSLLSIIGLNEFTQGARNVASYTYSNFESYLLLAAGYLVLTLPISLWIRRLEQRLRYET